MADLSKIKLNGNEYNLKDSITRKLLETKSNKVEIYNTITPDSYQYGMFDTWNSGSPTVSTAIYPVTPGNTYYITTTRNSSGRAFYIWLNSNKANLGSWEGAGTGNETVVDYEATAPDGAAFVKVINATLKPDMVVKEKVLQDHYDIDDEEELDFYKGAPLTAELETGWMSVNYTVNGTNSYHKKYMVSPKNTSYYYFSGKNSGSGQLYPAIIFFDANHKYVGSAGNDPTEGYIENRLIKIPEGTSEIVVNSGYPTKLELRETLIGCPYDYNAARALISEYNLTLPTTFDKPYVTFVVDDWSDDGDSIASIFEQKNMPLCAAPIYFNLDKPMNGLSAARGSFTPGMTARQCLLKVVENGGEILAHNSGYIKKENYQDKHFLYDHFINAKVVLENELNVTIDGIVRAGGEVDQYEPEDETALVWTIANYKYSNNSQKDWYNLERYTVNQDIAAIKGLIDDAVANNSWIRFMCHNYGFGGGTTFTGEADLLEILNYCESVGITVVTERYMYNKFSGNSMLTETDVLDIAPQSDWLATTGNAAILNKPSVYAGSASYAVVAGMGNQATDMFALATGVMTTASGQGAHTEGYQTTASANSSHAEGCNTFAGNTYAHAEGASTTANGYGSHAEGYKTITSSDYAHVEGIQTFASGYGAHAEGYSTTANGANSHAGGFKTFAAATASHAEGESTTASGYASHAEGGGTLASGAFSHAEGYNTLAQRRSQHAFGEYNVLDTGGTGVTVKGDYIEIVGNGTSTTRSNARTLDWNGNEVLAGKLTVGVNPVNDMDVVTKQYLESIQSIPTASLATEITDGLMSAADKRIINNLNSNVLCTLSDLNTNYLEIINAKEENIIDMEIAVEPIIARIRTNNLLDASVYIPGYYITSDNTLHPSTEDNLGDFIPVSPGDDIYYTGTVGPTNARKINRRLHVYNANKIWIKQINFASDLNEGDNWSTHGIVPSDGAYVRVSWGINDTHIMISVGAPTQYNSYYITQFTATSGSISFKIGVTTDPEEAITYTYTFPAGVGDQYGFLYNPISGKMYQVIGHIASYNGETLPEHWISNIDNPKIDKTPSIGAEVIYRLADEDIIEYDGTPITIPLNYHNNVFFIDNGKLQKLTYYAETVAVDHLTLNHGMTFAGINIQQQDIENWNNTVTLLDNIAPVEVTYIASQNYEVGDYVYILGTLYKITAAIISNEQFIVGTNIEATTIMDEIKALISAINS